MAIVLAEPESFRRLDFSCYDQFFIFRDVLDTVGNLIMHKQQVSIGLLILTYKIEVHVYFYFYKLGKLSAKKS